MVMATNNKGHSYNWGVIIPVVLALIGATWTLAVTFTGIRTDLTMIKTNVGAIKTNVGAIKTSVEKLQAAEPTPSKAEAETFADLQSKLEDLRADLQAVMTAEEEPSGDAPLPSLLNEICDGPAMPDDRDLISVGETVTGTLSETDEQMEDGTYFDLWVLPICESGTVTVAMESEVLDSYILLVSLSLWEKIGEDDDGGDGLHARLTVDVDVGLYLIAANTSSFGAFGESTGDYALSVQR
jgi:hypothetical protein